MRLSEPIPGEDHIAGGMASVLRNRLLLTHQRFSFPLSTSPKTGDNTPILFWILLAGVGMAGVGGTVILRKKKKK